MEVYKIKETDELVLLLAEGMDHIYITPTWYGITKALVTVLKLDGTKLAIDKDELEFIEEIQDE